MLKRWLIVPLLIVSTLLSACSMLATGKSVGELEEWGATQTEFPGLRVERHAWKMGTTGAGVYHSVDSYQEARRFEKVVSAEVARIGPPKSSKFVGRVDWPVQGGRTSYEFSLQSDPDEVMWQLADADLPEAATMRRIGWTEIDGRRDLKRSNLDLPIIEYDSENLVATAKDAPVPDGVRTLVRTLGDDWLGPFDAPELAPRARDLESFGPERVTFEGERLVLDPADMVEAARKLNGHAWELSTKEWTSIDVGPGHEPPLEQLAFAIAHEFTLSATDNQFRMGAPLGSPGCGVLLSGLPDPGRPFALSCPGEGAGMELKGTLTELRGMHPVGEAALTAGAKVVTIEPGRIAARLDPERRETWRDVTAAMRTLRWEGEWEVALHGYTARWLTMRSTADGKATDVDRFPNADEDYEKEMDELVAAWDDTA